MVRSVGWRTAALAAVAVASAVAGGARGTAAQESNQVARGEYLATAGNCAACHSAEGGEPFAGGRAVETPFGVLHSPNITPHDPTGIGDYTRAEFVAAMRDGINDDGEPMYPAHPYTFYVQMTDADIDAVWAYLQSLTPVENQVEVNQLEFPYNIRAGLRVWQAAFLEDERFRPNADRSRMWNRGAYLVEAVAHCGACHTPRNFAYARDEERMLEGAEIRGWYAPNIAAGDTSVIDAWSVEELVAYLQSGETSDNETSFGPMDQVVHDSLARLRTEDVRAMAVYLKDARPVRSAQVQGSVSMDYAAIASDERMYITNCSGCHRRDGEGVPGAAPTLVNNSAITTDNPNNVVMSMLQGLPPRAGWGGMPSYAEHLNDSEIAQIASYVRTAWGNDAPERATPELVAELRREATDVMAKEPWQAMCANLPRSQVDGALVARVGDVAEDGFTDDEIGQLVRHYAREFPDVDAGTAILGLSTGYCRHLAQAEPSREEALRRIGDFNSRIASTIGRSMPDVAQN